MSFANEPPRALCQYCKKWIIIESKRKGLKDHLLYYHQREWNEQRANTAEGIASSLRSAASLVGTNIENVKLTRPHCPVCLKEVVNSDLTGFGKHVLICSGQSHCVVNESMLTTAMKTMHGATSKPLGFDETPRAPPFISEATTSYFPSSPHHH